MSVYTGKETASYKLIYIYSIPYPDHEGILKIGEHSFTAATPPSQLTPNCELLQIHANFRILQQTQTALIPYKLEHCELALHDVQFANGETVTQQFSDRDIMKIANNSNIEVLPHLDSDNNSEWYRVDLKTAIELIETAKKGLHYLPTAVIAPPEKEGITLREEQRDNVEKTINMFKKYDTMLWNCKMRYGKTVTAYELIKNQGYKKVIVVTHRPAVQDGWKSDHDLIFHGTNHVFKDRSGDNTKIFDAHIDIKNEQELASLIKQDLPFTYFASMQDLRGSKRVKENGFNKNEYVFDLDWDLVIIDEAHEGTQTELGDSVITALFKDGTKLLMLSGTPYNIMDGFGENVFTWSYVDEQRAKEKWPLDHPGEKNPYDDLPKMNILTFDLSESLENSYRFVKEDIAFNFREFFRTWTGNVKVDFKEIPENRKIGDFVYHDSVEAFLDLITKDDANSNYPFATDESRDLFKHTFWVVPGTKEAKALSALLKSHPIFSSYEIVNVAGDGDEEKPFDEALKTVKDAIKNNDKTITISCGRLNTGVTVREWTAVMMLTGSSSTAVSSYMQTIFRAQSPGLIDGKRKENCYVFDFAPDRALKVIGEAHMLSSKKSIKDDDDFKASLQEFLNFCPVISLEGTKMEEFDVPTLMRTIRKISVESAINSGFDDDTIYKSETGIVMNEADKDILKKLTDIVVPQGKRRNETRAVINATGLTEEERRKLVEAKKNKHKKKPLTPEEKALLEKEAKQKKDQKKILDLLRAVSIRLPLLFFGAQNDIGEVIYLKDFVNIVDDESWNEFMPQKLKKDLFLDLLRFYDDDVIVGAGLRIRKMAKAADELPPTLRAKRIVEIIAHFKNPDKETVLTPWRVVNLHLGDTIGGYNFYDENGKEIPDEQEPRLIEQEGITTELLLNENAKILEINSKSGLYALYMTYSLYMMRVTGKEDNSSFEELQNIWDKVLNDNIFVVCKTKMARSITIRTLAGYTEKNVNTKYVPHLIENLKEDIPRIAKKIRNAANWNKSKEGDKLNFNAVVGNPPYQETVKFATNGNNDNTVDIYQYFQKLAVEIAPVVTLIYPAKELQRGKSNLLDKTLVKVRIYNGSNKETEKNIPGEPSVFGNAVRRIPGDVGVYLWDLSHPTETVNYQNVKISRTDKIMPVRKEFFNLATKLKSFANSAKDYSIRKCCESDFIQKNASMVLSEVSDRNATVPEGYSKVITNDKGGSGGKSNWYYIKTKALDFVQPPVYKVVISSAFPNEAFKNPNNIEILSNNEMFGRTKKCIYYTDNIKDAEWYKKYLNTDFVKAIVEMTPYKFLYYLPDFNDIKEGINWSSTVEEINIQLLNKYGLSSKDILLDEKSGEK